LASEWFEGRKCTPERGPDWDYSVPGGVNAKQVNGGYGLRLRDLQAGHYRIAVTQPSNWMDGETPGRSMVACEWAPGSTVKSVIEFDVH
jgi:hypothetical protein